MKYLLDTHVFLWWITDDSQLSPVRKEIISNPSHFIFLSVASAWEISIKEKLGKIHLHDSGWFEYFDNQEFQVVDITLPHIQRLHSLPPHHHDPFDRILISQALEEECVLITNDQKIQYYDIETQ